MNVMCRPCLCVLFVIGCICGAGADEKPSPMRSEYDKFIHYYRGESSTKGPPLKLVVTVIEAPNRTNSGEIGYACTVTAKGAYYARWGHFGSQGGGPTTIPADDQNQLNKLLQKLPDDAARLPPFDRRVILQVPEGDHFRARVYDRANAPDEVLEILRLSRSEVPSWVPKFESDGDVPVEGNYTYYGMIAVSPNRFATIGRSFKYWDPATPKELKEFKEVKDLKELPYGWNPQNIKFSPDGSLAVFSGDRWEYHCCVIDTKTWKVLRDFQAPEVGRYSGTLGFPQFTADGRFLVFLCSQPDSNGNRTILPRIYDTKSWEQRDRLPGFPENLLTCMEVPNGGRAVLFLKGGVVALWDSEQHREYAKLDENVLIRQVAFSRDGSLVVMATLPYESSLDGPIWVGHNFRIRIWKMATGELVHELYPFEQDPCKTVVGLQWTADAQYILAATDDGLNIWNAKSGRHRGNLIAGLSPIRGVVIVPDGSRVAAGGNVFRGESYNRTIRFWNLAAVLKQIRTFEDSLTGPNAGK